MFLVCFSDNFLKLDIVAMDEMLARKMQDDFEREYQEQKRMEEEDEKMARKLQEQLKDGEKKEDNLVDLFGADYKNNIKSSNDSLSLLFGEDFQNVKKHTEMEEASKALIKRMMEEEDAAVAKRMEQKLKMEEEDELVAKRLAAKQKAEEEDAAMAKTIKQLMDEEDAEIARRMELNYRLSSADAEIAKALQEELNAPPPPPPPVPVPVYNNGYDSNGEDYGGGESPFDGNGNLLIPSAPFSGQLTNSMEGAMNWDSEVLRNIKDLSHLRNFLHSRIGKIRLRRVTHNQMEGF